MQAFDIKKWIFSILGVVLLIGWFFLIYQRNQKDIGTLQKKLAYLQSEARKNIPESKIQEAKQQADSLQIVLNQKQSRIFPEKEFYDLGKKIGQAVGQYGLKIISIKPDYESLKNVRESSEDIKELPFQMELKGDFSQFTKWIDHLNALPFAIKFGEFSLEKESASSLSLKIDLWGTVLLGKRKPGGDENEKKPNDTKQTPAKNEASSS